MIEKTNLGVKPLGRGEVTSPEVQRRIECLRAYKKEMDEARPDVQVPMDEGVAHKYRVALLNFTYAYEMAAEQIKGREARARAKVKKFTDLFDSLGLSY